MKNPPWGAIVAITIFLLTALVAFGSERKEIEHVKESVEDVSRDVRELRPIVEENSKMGEVRSNEVKWIKDTLRRLEDGQKEIKRKLDK